MPVIVLALSRLPSISDGNTPEVKMGRRMLGIDTPELHFSMGSGPVSQNPGGRSGRSKRRSKVLSAYD